MACSAMRELESATVGKSQTVHFLKIVGYVQRHGYGVIL